MEQSLSERTQHVMGLARDEAMRLHHEYLGTEHVLLGIASESTGVAASVLEAFGVTIECARSGVERVIGTGPPSASPDVHGVTPRAQKVIDFAREEASLCGNLQVEPEHLLLGITREVHGVAAQVLCDLQASLEGIRENMLRLLAAKTTSD